MFHIIVLPRVREGYTAQLCMCLSSSRASTTPSGRSEKLKYPDLAVCHVFARFCYTRHGVHTLKKKQHRCHSPLNGTRVRLIATYTVDRLPSRFPYSATRLHFYHTCFRFLCGRTPTARWTPLRSRRLGSSAIMSTAFLRTPFLRTPFPRPSRSPYNAPRVSMQEGKVHRLRFGCVLKFHPIANYNTT